MNGNNPPAATLELDQGQAEFLLKNCNVNIALSLSLLQRVERDTAEKIIAQTEQFKALRDMLLRQGVTVPDDEE